MSWFTRTPLDAVRWVVVDCETSGLDIARDRLLSVGAAAVQGGRIRLADRFSALVGQSEPSDAANILVHGIGGDAQCAGRPLAEVMREFESYLGDARPVAFHAPFDAGILRRHGLKRGHDWLDLATLMPVLYPQRAPKESSLDPWLREFAITAPQRHDALGDALATAELFLVALAEVRRQRVANVEALLKLSRANRWIA